MTPQTKSLIKAVLDQIKTESFVRGYVAPDAEAMGLLVSKYFEWDGIQILESSFFALEDANFHTEAGIVYDLCEKAKA